MIVEVIVRGDDQAAALLDRLGGRLEDGTPALTSLVDTLLEIHQDRILHQRGVRWKKLARSTLRRDRAGGRDPRPMIDSGRLLRSLTVRGAPGQIVRVTPTSLRFGTNVWYARFHQQGKGVPRRTVVGLSRQQRKLAVMNLRELLLGDLT